MPCQQISQVVNLLHKHDIHPSSSDVVAIVCASCNEDEVCPARRDAAMDSADSTSISVQDSSNGVHGRTQNAT